MPKIDRPAKPLDSYDILGLCAAGGRFSDWTTDDAVEEYVRLHPGSTREDVRAELKRELDRINQIRAGRA